MNAPVLWYPSMAEYQCLVCDWWSDYCPFPSAHHAPWCRRVTWAMVWDARMRD